MISPHHHRRLVVASLLVIFLLICAAGFNGTMDVLQFCYSQSVFAKIQNPAVQQWLNPQLSWHNKWKNGERAQGEAFPLSSTALVCTTDAWHLCKSGMLACIYLAILTPFTLLVKWHWSRWVLAFFGLSILFGSVFELFFTKLLIVK